jgi:hyperosmotically inducible protein
MSITMQRISCAAAVVTLAFLSACTSTSTQRSTGEYVDDATLTAKVKTALTDSEEVKAQQIDVEAYRGVVQLNGFVETAEARSAATRVAQSVDGVREVRNNLSLGEGNESVSEVTDDGVVTTKVKAALIADPVTKAHEINVATNQGVVQLSGFVDSAEQKSKASEIARSIEGVRDVQNQLDIKPAQ